MNTGHFFGECCQAALVICISDYEGPVAEVWACSAPLVGRTLSCPVCYPARFEFQAKVTLGLRVSKQCFVAMYCRV